jgi:hypothetical protein
MAAWSYSSIKTFEQCAKKYYHLKVLKDVADTGGEAMVYGNELHKAAENYIKAGTPIPSKFDYVRAVLDALKQIPGEKHCEQRLAVSYDGTDYAATTYFAKNVWWRGVVDLLIIEGQNAYLVDYKTGKNAKYADTTQLDMLAAAVFTHYPEVDTIRSALVYVVSNEFVQKVHTREFHKSYYATFDDQLARLEVAEKTNVWNAVSGPLCAYCPVKSCEHNSKR